ncbi:DMT family transporter [Undibacterium cyanobacteriorum]|uniref:DMT family transporter n=1 Tax=Undibacterium cyanobacteriorum TaxID=3073561 RepID=A0ABY9RPL0_9BURK|nr:DMT family transporter [Undibacterium sp. 20NA77.5]WMW82377.1 DMT family transporter [Undibacterium sp. 20NA77.5]
MQQHQIVQPSHKQALFLMVIAPAMWSSAGVLSRKLESARGFEVSFWRSFFAALFVIIALAFQHRSRLGAKLKGLGKFGLFSGLMWGSMFSCFMLAITMTTVANALIVESLSPLLTAIFAWIFLKEKIPTRTWLAILVAFVGMVWMFIDGFSKLDGRGLIGVILATCVPLAASSNVIILKRGGQDVDLIPAVFVGGLISACLMLPMALPFSASVHDLIILATLGVFQLGVPCMLMVHAAKGLSAPELSLLSLLEVLLGPLWVWMAVGEVPAQATLVGGAIVLTALIFNEVTALHLERKEAATH